jgi:hypothetical protein
MIMWLFDQTWFDMLLALFERATGWALTPLEGHD